MSEKLTSNRKAVLAILNASPTAMSAYEILDCLHRHDSKWKPATVYRALNYLIDGHYVHRIESEQKFISCTQTHDGSDRHFLICQQCGNVSEHLLDERAKYFLTALAEDLDFQLRSPYLESHGLCHNCRNN